MPTFIEHLAFAAIGATGKADHPSQEPYIEHGDPRAVLIDGTVDMCGVAEAVVRKLIEALERKQEGEDWAAEYGESEAAAVAASETSDLIAMIEDKLSE